MRRRLLPATIVDPDLYVVRAADSQLDNAIDDMGRPPYILVARQMGKTNLLINMKRRRESMGDIVVYFDLTARHDSPRSFFRSIIDVISEQIDSLLGRQIEAIEAIRKSNHEPIVEYERSLRNILKSIGNKKLVLVFDEVDSLVKVSYSDIIFSQIRSIYFLRVNHNEYWRLTYVLSGVADPSVLIKDRNISPFNIGEKIYLSDFSRDEVVEFLRRADLHFEQVVLDKLYALTGGHPRMVWEISSRLEDIAATGEIVTPTHVQDVVNRLYMSNFDMPPVDHIRTLVEEDYQLRSAVIALRAGGQVDPATRTKLYLAGICRADEGTTSVTIKNAIIDGALSMDWLTSLPEPEDTILSAVREAFERNDYERVSGILSPHIGSTLLSKHPRAKQQLALSLLLIGRLREALPLLEQLAAGPEGQDITEANRFYHGLALQKIGLVHESIPVLKMVADGSGRSAMPAAVALMTSLIATNSLAEAEQIGLSMNFDGEITDDNATLATSAFFNLGKVYEFKGTKREAETWYQRALSFAPSTMVPAIELQLSMLAEFRAQKLARLELATRQIVEGHLPVSKFAYFDLALQPHHILRLLESLLKLRAEATYLTLLNYSKSTYGTVDDSPTTYLLRLVRSNKFEPCD
ncbi:MAG: AAA-like domain-containing protein, partial [Devosia sp.]